MKKVLLLPGWMTALKLYKNYSNDFSISFGKLSKEDLSADYVIGLSLGALVALTYADDIKGKMILINPPVPKRNFSTWFTHLLKYIKTEGLFLQRQHFTNNPIKFISEFSKCVGLLRKDFSNVLYLYNEKIFVIRSKEDAFFCDQLAFNFLDSKDVKIAEIDGGHNWNEKMEDAMNSFAN